MGIFHSIFRKPHKFENLLSNPLDGIKEENPLSSPQKSLIPRGRNTEILSPPLKMKTLTLTLSCALLFIILPQSAHPLEIIGDRAVKYVEQPENWFTAYEKCRAKGMQLLTIHNMTDYEQILELAKKYKPRPSFWLAGTDNGHEGTFIYATNGEPVPNLWPTGQPDNGFNRVIENCIEVTYRWGENPVWNDIPCGDRFPYFCQGTETLPGQCVA